jgi:hypothetical protein
MKTIKTMRMDLPELFGKESFMYYYQLGLLDHIAELEREVEKLKDASEVHTLKNRVADLEGRFGANLRRRITEIENRLDGKCAIPDPPKFEGYEWTGEFREPRNSEYYQTIDGAIVRCYSCPRTDHTPRYIYRKLEAKPDPRQVDVDVAKALGNNVFTLTDYEPSMAPNGSPPYFNTEKVPHYSTDLTAAMNALEEYCEKENIVFRIYKSGVNAYTCRFNFEDRIESASLPLAICHAIIEHHKTRAAIGEGE